MSASQWRRAMRSRAAGAAVAREARGARDVARVSRAPRDASVTQGPRVAVMPRSGNNATRPVEPPPAHGDLPRWLRTLCRPVRWRHAIVLALVLLYPFIATPFFTFQIGAQALALGLIALSLTFLGGYGGMVSLAQMTVAGFAAYLLAIFGTSSNAAISLGWPWWLALVFAVALATLLAAGIGWLSVRTEGIYTIMITLAVGVAFFYLAQQNYTLFNGFQGFSKIEPPTWFDVDLREPMAFYF